jgi:carboxyl-terminal processing protease
MQMRIAPVALLALLSSVAILLAVPSGILLWRQVTEPLPREELAVLRLVHDQIRKDYYRPTDSRKLMIAAISGMVADLDRFSEFVAEEDVAEFVGREIEGTYLGIGVSLVPDRQPITVEFPFANGPAERAGLRPGDRILGTDQVDFDSLPMEEFFTKATAAIRGEAGSRVELIVARADAEPTRVVVTREAVSQPLAKWDHLIDRERRLGYVHIAGFQRGVEAETVRAIESMMSECGDAGLAGIILDLRFNPGGLLDEAVLLANRFVPEGDIVRLERRDTMIEKHTAKPERCRWPQLPIVLLVNGESASASEVLAGALSDYERARLVGTKTYGKAVVQSIYSFRDRDFRLKMTTASYVTPKGRDLGGGAGAEARSDSRTNDGRGLEPDRSVALVRRDQERIRGRLRDHEVPRVHRDAVRTLAERLGFSPSAPLSTTEDPQLAAAVEELTAMIARRAEEPKETTRQR